MTILATATAALIGACVAEGPALQVAKISGAIVVQFPKTRSLVIEWPHRGVLFKRHGKRICVSAVTELKDGVAVDGDY